MDISNFSNHLRQILSEADRAAKEYGTNYIGSEHLVLAMLRVPESTAGRLLKASGVEYEAYREHFRRALSHDSTGKYDFTPRTKYMLSLAKEYAMQNERFGLLVGSEHLLLAVLTRDDCLAVDILRRLGIGLKMLIARTEAFIGPADDGDDFGQDGETATPAEEENTPPTGEVRHLKPFVFDDEDTRQEETERNPIDTALLPYGVDLTKKAREGKLDPVIGRRKEIEKVIQILYVEDKAADSLTGTKHFHFWSAAAGSVEFTLEQTVEGLAPGAYRYAVSIMGGDSGESEIYAYVQIDGETTATEPMTITSYGQWDTAHIEDIALDEGQSLTVGVYVKCAGAGGGAWGKIDDASLKPMG